MQANNAGTLTFPLSVHKIAAALQEQYNGPISFTLQVILPSLHRESQQSFGSSAQV